jgi:hypothetical protein
MKKYVPGKEVEDKREVRRTSHLICDFGTAGFHLHNLMPAEYNFDRDTFVKM